jgi:NAD(P)-dependent dehydrogenase (short-subunit alcohol dehydrogenase family)
VSEPPRTILITGCSSGIGHAAALGLKARGWRVFAAARREEDCASLRSEGLESVRLDYRDAGSIATAFDDVLRLSGGRLDALFNNGGYAQAGALEDMPTDLVRAQFETNVFGWHDLTRRVIPVMRRQGGGRIVFCSSVLGFAGARFRGAYVASKFAIEGLADSLRLELHGTGIHVVLIEPGPINSRFRHTALAEIDRTIDIEASVHRDAYRLELARRARGESSSPFRQPPEAVVRKLVHALESRRPKLRYRVTFPTGVGWYLKRVLPSRAMDWVIRRLG